MKQRREGRHLSSSGTKQADNNKQPTSSTSNTSYKIPALMYFEGFIDQKFACTCE